MAIVAVPPDEIARSSAPLALEFERLTGMALKTMSLIAVDATRNGIIVHIIMIAGALYGPASQGSLADVLTRLNHRIGRPTLATVVGVGAILPPALAVPLSGLADLTARFTFMIFAIVDAAILRIKSRGAESPANVVVCPRWVPAAGPISSLGLLALDGVAR